MLDNDCARALELARQTISLLNEKDFFGIPRKGYERDMERAIKANRIKARPFNGLIPSNCSSAQKPIPMLSWDAPFSS